jgi:alpha-methylacyl-CoA racemase
LEKICGPLVGLKVVEFAGLGPGPMAGMLLADLGATVIRLDRVVSTREVGQERYDLLLRNKTTLQLDLKSALGKETCLALIEKADALIEGFRPGTMERLGLGPADVHARNPALVYGRVTGWGQDGPLAQEPGHDINFIALSGALAAIGRRNELPAPPLALIGDFSGGALYLAFGMMSALFEAQRSGKGQVVDAAMLDGALSMMTAFYGLFAGGEHGLERGTNLLDSGSAFYDVYRCACGGLVSVGAVEIRFRKNLLRVLGIDAAPHDAPGLREKIEASFKSRTRDQWIELMQGQEACFAPVLDMAEAPSHEHNRARATFVTVDGIDQPAVAPRFSRTGTRSPNPHRISTLEAVLDTFGIAGTIRDDLIRRAGDS